MYNKSGLKDKNGKEICNGDKILCRDGKIREVFFSKGGFSVTGFMNMDESNLYKWNENCSIVPKLQ
jgi:hypothetical protein